ncbi:MAG: hypothetical protein ACP5N7_05420 [Candidatus Pacearchaeota archaeon]
MLPLFFNKGDKMFNQYCQDCGNTYDSDLYMDCQCHSRKLEGALQPYLDRIKDLENEVERMKSDIRYLQNSIYDSKELT